MGQRDGKFPRARRPIKVRFCERAYLLAFSGKITGLRPTASRARAAWRDDGARPAHRRRDEIEGEAAR